jgi:hypothetical protein
MRMNTNAPIIPIHIIAKYKKQKGISSHLLSLLFKNLRLTCGQCVVLHHEKCKYEKAQEKIFEKPKAILDMRTGITTGLDAKHKDHKNSEECGHSHAHSVKRCQYYYTERV